MTMMIYHAAIDDSDHCDHCHLIILSSNPTGSLIIILIVVTKFAKIQLNTKMSLLIKRLAYVLGLFPK